MNTILYRFATQNPRAYKALQRWVWIPYSFLLVFVLRVGVWALDREPPFRLIAASTNAPSPGGVLTVSAQVRRDLDRDCSVLFSRYLFDRNGFRHESMGPQLMTPEALRIMDEIAPGRLNVSLRIPPEFPPGAGTMNTVLEYRCNPLQDLIRPIQVEMVVPFEVLP